MCGIAGIIGRLGDANGAALEAMTRALAHRGPDASGLWASPPDAGGFGCMLGFRRLAILDLTESANQPMTDPKTGHTVVFNGEIYNYRALRDELSAAGESFQSTGDTAVMLRALSVRGPSVAVRQLRGMFAFALWDGRNRTLTLARDPLGMKPLYICLNPYAHAEWSLLFASEVRAILASGLLGKPRLNPSAVASVVWNGFVAGPQTAVEGVESLEPGELRTYDAKGHQPSAERYWTMPRPDRNGAAATEADVRDALQESVRLHLVSDVPLGVFLSGGVDSGSVANLAQKARTVASAPPVDTFTLAFEEPEYNEADHARAIAAAIGTRHHEIPLTESGFVGDLDQALDGLDQPTFDGLNTYAMSRAVRDAGLKVALVGTGGDELFGGYRSFRDVPRLHRLAEGAAPLPAGARRAAGRLVAALAGARHNGGAFVGQQTRWAKLPDVLLFGADLLYVYQLAYALFLPDFQRRLVRDELREHLSSHGGITAGLPHGLRERLRSETHGRSPLATVSVLEQRCFLGERLLRDSDAASMAASLELRLPLVDAGVVGAVNLLPDRQRFHPLGRKNLLRRVGLSGLDPRLFDRPKSGFVLPYDRWIRRGLGREMDGVMRDRSAAAAVGLNGETVATLWQAYQDESAGLYWSRVWAVYVLIRWCHRHGVFL